MKEIDVEELARWRAGGKAFVLLDVRLPVELQRAALPKSVNIPVQELAGRLDEIDREAVIAVICHSGNRSRYATELLERGGYPNAYNVAGGIDAYARVVDPTVPRY